MPRMKILSTTEQERFDRPPVFSSAERKRFFDFSSTLLGETQRIRSPSHRICFLLMCGYFRVTKKFFSPHDYHQQDIEYVANHSIISLESFNASDIPETTRRRHRQQIMAYYGFRDFDEKSENYIAKEISEMSQAQLKPKLIFWRCVDVLIRNRIQVTNWVFWYNAQNSIV